MSNDRISLAVEKREISGKKVAQVRDAGLIPAVIYGADFEPVNIQAPYLDFQKVVRTAGTHSPVDIKIGDSKVQTAIIKTIDINPVTNRISHVAFQAVSADQVVTTYVPIIVIDEDESEAKKAGLNIMQFVDELEIKAKPADLPERLEISAKDLKVDGEKLTVADIKLPEGVAFADKDEDFQELTIATVQDPVALAAAAEAAEKAVAEAEAAAKVTETTEEGSEEAAKESEGAAEAEKPSEGAAEAEKSE